MKHYKTQILKESDREIIDTKHSLARWKERYTQISPTVVNRVLNDVIQEILHTYKDKGGEYGFHSKSTGIGGIAYWERYGDPRFDTGKNNLVIKTMFPIKKFHTYRNVDATIIVENHIIEWAKSKGFTGEKKKYLCENYKNKDYSFWVSFFEGNLYAFKLDGYIVVK